VCFTGYLRQNQRTTKLRQVRIILPFPKLSDKTKQTNLGTSTKYIHKSHMSAVVYTSMSHRSTQLDFKVLQSSYQVAKTTNTGIFQGKVTCSSLKTYN